MLKGPRGQRCNENSRGCRSDEDRIKTTLRQQPREIKNDKYVVRETQRNREREVEEGGVMKVGATEGTFSAPSHASLHHDCALIPSIILGLTHIPYLSPHPLNLAPLLLGFAFGTWAFRFFGFLDKMGIDLNTIEEEEEEPEQSAYHAASPPAATPLDRALQVCLELWHACAGPRIWLPKKGSLVVYFPQGHIEHFGEDGDRRGGVYRRDVPPHVFCRVVDVKLHVRFRLCTQADAATDEVYAQLSLLAESEDYKLQKPSQELIAKDLHGTKWTFRHIYRGISNRSKPFVILCLNRIFHSVIRGNDGELRLGVRRAAQFKSGSPVSAHPSGNIIANSVSTRNIFHIYYSPRYASCGRLMFYANFCICKSLC
ncbi:hypothetical protein BHE74_00028126, partial [Ensete ventricosum]